MAQSAQKWWLDTNIFIGESLDLYSIRGYIYILLEYHYTLFIIGYVKITHTYQYLYVYI